MSTMTNKQHALTALAAFADDCRNKLAGNVAQIAQIEALVSKAEATDESWYDAQGYGLHSGHGSSIADGRAVAQAVAKA